MAVFRCKMCGASLDIVPGMEVCECESCGTAQTLPKFDDDKRVTMYERANHFRRNNEFDKAMGMYEQILNEDRTDAEAYWSIVLCRYGIEYVEDPVTKKESLLSIEHSTLPFLQTRTTKRLLIMPVYPREFFLKMKPKQSMISKRES